MAIQVGDRIPDVNVNVAQSDGMEATSTSDLMKGKVVLFAVPGAFTPMCSEQHLPGYVRQADAILAKGVDKIVCLSVNDGFVMGAWGKAQNVGDKVVMAADGSADLTRALGLELDATGFGMGVRAQRFALIADNGVVTHLAVEDNPTKVEGSSAEAILAAL
jgi:peroxiredoxin